MGNMDAADEARAHEVIRLGWSKSSKSVVTKTAWPSGPYAFCGRDPDQDVSHFWPRLGVSGAQERANSLAASSPRSTPQDHRTSS
jgi:hypothetical protein